MAMDSSLPTSGQHLLNRLFGTHDATLRMVGSSARLAARCSFDPYVASVSNMCGLAEAALVYPDNPETPSRLRNEGA